MTAPTVSAVVIADALVEYALRHADDAEAVERCAAELDAMDYGESAYAVRRYRTLVTEHAVKP